MTKFLEPYQQRLREALQALSAAQAATEVLRNAVLEYRNFDRSDALAKSATLTREVTVKEASAKTLHDLIQQQTVKIADIDRTVASRWNPGAWLKPDERARWAHQRVEQQALAELCAKLEAATMAIGAANTEKAAIDERVASHDAFNMAAALEDLQLGEARAARAQADVDLHQGRLDRVFARIEPLLPKYRETAREYQSLASDLDYAQKQEAALGAASNGYERSLIHQECTERLNESSPRRFRQLNVGRLDRLKRDREKLEARIRKEVVAADRHIARLYVDGLNLCRERQRLIGLLALSQLVPKLKEQIDDIVIIFDAEVYSVLRMDHQAIERKLGAGIAIYVTPGKADDYLTRAASESPGAYILTNDRFADFFDREVVKAQRLITHHIMDGRALISDLNIDVSF